MAKFKPIDLPSGADNPLNAAVMNRDRDTLEMVTQAVKHQQTLLAFQPVVIAQDSGRVGFYEGLIRVMDDTGRIIPAKDFMPVVERAELGREIDVVALNMGLRTLHENPSVRISINMSARSIGYQRWMQTLNRWLKKDATVGERLILEITEGSAMDQPELVVDFMDRLSARGICFALDDFGAGYTALRYFKEFFFDVLKIDMQFCAGIADDPDTQVLTRAMIQIGHHFDMLVVGEGVERAEDVEMLMQLGVDCLQGYYFQAPQVRPGWLASERRKAGMRA
ncbi:EAL domain-containing protein [uncultured Tateyamaria sp.]|uniref:EAL domain-containing protein n=1 Tax=uncultured Tateyamaria sp. TaxID=455651 RepID=UPI00260882BE|nr:EAL domain-containing protein [uncultured Tateyamaria sp.]